MSAISGAGHAPVSLPHSAPTARPAAPPAPAAHHAAPPAHAGTHSVIA